MSDEKPDTLNLDPEAIKFLQEIEDKIQNGEEVDPLTQEAIESIKFASQIVNSVMSGKLIDLAYLRMYTENVTNRMNKVGNFQPPKRRGRRKRITREELANKVDNGD